MTSGVYKRKSVRERFEEKYIVNSVTGCWEWQANAPNGYGQFYHEGTMKRAHKFSYELYKEVVPEGKVLDHLCRVKTCCNPEHLEIVTQKINVARGNAGKTCIERAKKQTHCKKGHEFTQENTYISKNNARHCKACNKVRQRAYRA